MIPAISVISQNPWRRARPQLLQMRFAEQYQRSPAAVFQQLSRRQHAAATVVAGHVGNRNIAELQVEYHQRKAVVPGKFPQLTHRNRFRRRQIQHGIPGFQTLRQTGQEFIVGEHHLLHEIPISRGGALSDFLPHPAAVIPLRLIRVRTAEIPEPPHRTLPEQRLRLRLQIGPRPADPADEPFRLQLLHHQTDCGVARHHLLRQFPLRRQLLLPRSEKFRDLFQHISPRLREKRSVVRFGVHHSQ